MTHLESLTSGGDIHRCDIHHTLVLTLMVIPQERNNGNHTTRRNAQRQFILVHGKLLHEFRQTSRQVLSVLMQRRR